MATLNLWGIRVKMLLRIKFVRYHRDVQYRSLPLNPCVSAINSTTITKFENGNTATKRTVFLSELCD